MTQSLPAQRSGARLPDVMRQLAGGVAVITAGKVPDRSGYTGTAVFSLSINPERIVISVGRNSSSYPIICGTSISASTSCAANSSTIADRFAGRGGVKGRSAIRRGGMEPHRARRQPAR